MNLKNKKFLLFVQTYQKNKEVPFLEMSRDNVQKRREPPYMEMSRDNDQNTCVYKLRNAAPKSLFKFLSQKINHFFQLPAFYLVHPWFTTLLLPWTR